MAEKFYTVLYNHFLIKKMKSPINNWTKGMSPKFKQGNLKLVNKHLEK